jgi:hypothetical protein
VQVCTSGEHGNVHIGNGRSGGTAARVIIGDLPRRIPNRKNGIELAQASVDGDGLSGCRRHFKGVVVKRSAYSKHFSAVLRRCPRRRLATEDGTPIDSPVQIGGITRDVECVATLRVTEPFDDNGVVPRVQRICETSVGTDPVVAPSVVTTRHLSAHVRGVDVNVPAHTECGAGPDFCHAVVSDEKQGWSWQYV